MTRLSAWPMPVAMAAPSMPSWGKGPMPKISSGSSTMLVTAPLSMLTMVSIILPTA